MVSLTYVPQYVRLLVLLVLVVMQQPATPFLVALKSLGRLHHVQRRTAVRTAFHTRPMRRAQSEVDMVAIASSLSGQGTHHSIAMDLSSVGWGILSVSGPDRYRFLQGMSTADVAAAQVGDVVWGCFLNSKGKVFDYNMMLIDHEDIKIICEARGTARLMNYLDKFIFPKDQVKLKDMSGDWNIISYLTSVTPSNSTNSEYKFTNKNNTYSIPCSIFNRPYFAQSVFNEVGKALSNAYIEIRSITHPKTRDVEEVRCQTLCLKDEICSIFYDYIRILIGKPKLGQEIEWFEKDIKYTAFELGIADFAITLDKGCYTGQEIVSKAIKSLNTQAFPSACRRRLVTLSGNNHVDEGVLKYNNEEVGTVTSLMRLENLQRLKDYLSSGKSCNDVVENWLSLVNKSEAGPRVSLALIASRILQDDSVDSYEQLKSQILPPTYGDFSFPVLKSKLLAKEHEQNRTSPHQETDTPKSFKEADDERKRQKLEMIAQKIAALKKRGDR